MCTPAYHFPSFVYILVYAYSEDGRRICAFGPTVSNGEDGRNSDLERFLDMTQEQIQG